MSSSCASLKSVVMRGCVSGEPSPAGWGVAARLPSGRTRRLSFSIPRRMLLIAGASTRTLCCSCDKAGTQGLMVTASVRGDDIFMKWSATSRRSLLSVGAVVLLVQGEKANEISLPRHDGPALLRKPNRIVALARFDPLPLEAVVPVERVPLHRGQLAKGL